MEIWVCSLFFNLRKHPELQSKDKGIIIQMAVNLKECIKWSSAESIK